MNSVRCNACRMVAILWRQPGKGSRWGTEGVGVRRMHSDHDVRAHVGVGSPKRNPVAGYMRGWWSPRGVPPSSNSVGGAH
jgi:hypothetical protein